MWRIHMRFADLEICHTTECNGCQSSDLKPQSIASTSGPDFRAMKSNAVAMQTLRQIVQRHDLGAMSVSRSTDDQVVARIECMIGWGSLRVCRGTKSAPSAVETERDGFNDIAHALVALQAAEDLKLRGRSFRIIPAREWHQYRQASDYEIVPVAQAREALGSMAADLRRSEAERRTLRSALDLLSDDGRMPPKAEIVLLRRAQAYVQRSSVNDVITPTALARAVAPKENIHWIEIEMLGEDGVGVPQQAYLVVTPDKQQVTGVTDRSGRARLDGLVAGQCRVSFPNLDKGAWRAA